MNKLDTCEYCKHRGPLLDGGYFICQYFNTPKLSKRGHCEYHESVAHEETPTGDEADVNQGTLFD